jgi:hypothetical protein
MEEQREEPAASNRSGSDDGAAAVDAELQAQRLERRRASNRRAQREYKARQKQDVRRVGGWSA